MSIHLEVKFEDEICDCLSRTGWFYEKGSAAKYNRELALYPPDLIAWVKESQEKDWETLKKKHKSKAEPFLLQQIRSQLNLAGTLDVLRHGVDVFGLKNIIKLTEFKPQLSAENEVIKRHKANRLRIIRQVKYSIYNENYQNQI